MWRIGTTQKCEEWMNEGMTEGINEWRNEWVKEWMSEEMNEGMNEARNEWVKEWVKKWMSERMNEWRNEWVKKWRNDWMKNEGMSEEMDEWRNEWVKERLKEWISESWTCTNDFIFVTEECFLAGSLANGLTGRGTLHQHHLCAFQLAFHLWPWDWGHHKSCLTCLLQGDVFNYCVVLTGTWTYSSGS